MKNCPSCGSELAIDALECLCGYTYEEESIEEDDLAEAVVEETDDETADAEEQETGEVGGFAPIFPTEAPTTKPCVFCGSEIAIPATRCAHCAGFLPIAEGTIFKQYFFYLFCCIAITAGALLPWERSYLKGNLTGVDSISGGFLLLFAIYGIVVSVWNIYHRKMIVWPALLAALDGTIAGWQRIFQIADKLAIDVPVGSSAFFKFQFTVKAHAVAFGPGLYLVTIFSSLVLLSVVVSVFKGAKQDARRKADERESRAAARKSRR